MASPAPTKPVIIAPKASRQLDEIWYWNLERYGRPHADAYRRFLNDSIAKLATHYKEGKDLPSDHGLRYVLLKRRAKVHGHIVVYRIKDSEIRVLHVFHTAQAWQTKLSSETEE